MRMLNMIRPYASFVLSFLRMILIGKIVVVKLLRSKTNILLGETMLKETWLKIACTFGIMFIAFLISFWVVIAIVWNNIDKAIDLGSNRQFDEAFALLNFNKALLTIDQYLQFCMIVSGVLFVSFQIGAQIWGTRDLMEVEEDE